MHTFTPASSHYCPCGQSIKVRRGCLQSIWSACLFHASFVCVCVCAFAGPSPCLPALPPLYCVHEKIHTLSLARLLSLSCNLLSLISVLLGWSPLPLWLWLFLEIPVMNRFLLSLQFRHLIVMNTNMLITLWFFSDKHIYGPCLKYSTPPPKVLYMKRVTHTPQVPVRPQLLFFSHTFCNLFLS